MKKEELQEALKQLEEQGWNPMICDTPVPLFDVGVKCGIPNDVGDIVRQYASLPHEMVSLNTEFTITVKGDSMKDANIFEGDIVKVVPEVPIHDGDIVVARIDGEWVVKSYCEDEDGNPWLVPQNDNYDAFPLLESQDVWLLGKVDRIIRNAPRASFKFCKKMIEKAKAKEAGPTEISPLQVAKTIREIAPQITVARQWYAVFKAMMEADVVKQWDYDAFCILIREEVPHHHHLPTRLELQRMAIGSFARSIVLWTENDAPVRGKRFDTYKKLARQTKAMLGD